MEHFFSHAKDFGPWALSLVGSVLAWLLRTATKEIRLMVKNLGETQVKAELAYEEVSERVPAVKMKYEFWQAHR